MGLTRREAAEVRAELADTGALHHAVLFLNHADDPAIDRLLTPRAALTAAEHLAYEAGYHVLVVLCDMTAYCEALREVGIARGRSAEHTSELQSILRTSYAVISLNKKTQKYI